MVDSIPDLEMLYRIGISATVVAKAGRHVIASGGRQKLESGNEFSWGTAWQRQNAPLGRLRHANKEYPYHEAKLLFASCRRCG